MRPQKADKVGTMSNKNTGFFPEWLQSGFVHLLNPLITFSSHLGLSPNTFTVLGLVFNIAGAAVIIMEPLYIHLGGLLILLGGVCDVMDGKLARSSGKETRFGALFDSSIDRYSEVIMFFGIAAFYVGNHNYLLSVVAFAALGGSTMVSYVRARAEGLGFKAKMGLMQRPERVVLIGFGALLYYPLFHISLFQVINFPVTLLEISIWAVAVFANITAIQRIIFVYIQDK